MSLSLTLNRYLTLLWCFNCYCWTCTLSKVNNGIIRKKCAICSELTIKTPEQRHDDFEQCRITWRKKILADCKTTSFQLTKIFTRSESFTYRSSHTYHQILETIISITIHPANFVICDALHDLVPNASKRRLNGWLKRHSN